MPNIMSKIMTWEEQATKEEIMDILGKQGYPTYAHLFDKFALHLTADPGVVGYMIPDKGIIVLNRFLSLNQVSTIVRHEILHQYLEHGRRELAKLGVDSFDDISDVSLHELSNIAGDYEISNKGYTEKDKRIVRAIRLNGEVLKGLVTEDDHEDWVDLTYEEMFDKLIEERKKRGSESGQAKQQAQIGSQGSSEMQKAEAAQRAAQIAQEQAEEAAENAQSDEERKEAQEAAEKAAKASQMAKDAIDKLSKSSGQKSDSGDDADGSEEGSSDGDDSKDGSNSHSDSHGEGDGVFSDYTLSPQDLEEIKRRLVEIKDVLSDTTVGAKVQRDSTLAKRKEKDDAKQRKETAFRNNPLNKFVSSLNGFIEKEIEYVRDRTWKKVNPTYEPTGIMRQGITSSVQRTVPLVQVYYDRSGSWDGVPQKEEIGKRGVESLQKYVREGLLKVEEWYFDTKVSRSPENMNGGTAGTPILENIKATRPDNVIVVTDSDITDCTEKIQVPGAVWFLFVDGVSENLKDHLSGKRLTRSFEIGLR
jgi:hypothetical protein